MLHIIYMFLHTQAQNGLFYRNLTVNSRSTNEKGTKGMQTKIQGYIKK